MSSIITILKLHARNAWITEYDNVTRRRKRFLLLLLLFLLFYFRQKKYVTKNKKKKKTLEWEMKSAKLKKKLHIENET